MNSGSRRSFLRCLGQVSAAGGTIFAGVAGCTARPGRQGSKSSASLERAGDLPVCVEAPSDPLVQRTMSILADRVGQRCPVAVRTVSRARDARLVLALDRRLPEEGFRIDDHGGTVRISGGSSRGLLYGVGKLLRTSRYDAGFEPSTWRGESAPRGPLRGMYFASHFHNWYHQASEAEMTRYVEDLALWGVNALWTAFPAMNLRGWDDPAAGTAVSMLRQHARAAHAVGLRYGTSVNNTWFSGTPDAVRAKPLADPTGRRGNHGFPVCPSLPAGREYILDNTRRLFERLEDSGVDLLVFWPYDEGGCACERCQPWGSNGYLRISKEQTLLARKFFPGVRTILSTWMFDTPPEGEWAGLAEAAKRDPGWIDFILADAHEDFPRYPLDVGVPGHLPLLNFPEISMWGNWPWGGFGANPLPERFQRLWDQVKGVVGGGFPYSEGIYEDLNKAVELQFYWDPNRTARETVAEYSDYEFGPGVAGEVLTLVHHLESASSESYRKRPVAPEAARESARLAADIDARLPEWGRRNWRWEIVRLRAVLDRERFGGGGLGLGLGSSEAEAAMLRLMEIYHSQLETDDPYHHRVRPPLRRAVSRNGNH